jgi:uncharacterized protein YndB with AHSA1/START domain
MFTFAREETITVPADPESVFDYLSDIARHGEWAGNALDVRAAGADRFESTAVAAGVKLHAKIAVESRDRPTRFAYVVDDRTAGRYRWTFALSAAEGGTRIVHRMERLDAPVWMKLIQPWMTWPMLGRPAMRRGLERIRTHFASVPAAAQHPA